MENVIVVLESKNIIKSTVNMGIVRMSKTCFE